MNACVNVRLSPCGHTNMCLNCAVMAVRGNTACPTCRVPITNIQKIYYTGMDNDEMFTTIKYMFFYIMGREKKRERHP